VIWICKFDGGSKDCREIFYGILFQITFLELREGERITLRYIIRNSVVVITGGTGS
jgi:hypothetical protein